MGTPTVNVPLERFPKGVADELKNYAEKHSLHCAKMRRGKEMKKAFEELSGAWTHIASFSEKCKGWLSDESSLEIEKMLEYAGWHAANTKKSKSCLQHGSRKGYENDASINKRKLEQHYENVVKKKEISETLAKNVRDMGLSAAWFAANKIYDDQAEARRQKEELNTHFAEIHGEITEAEILSERPQINDEDNATEPALEILPIDVAEEIKDYAEKVAWYCSRKGLGDRGEADADRIEAIDHFDSFRKKCNGLLSVRSCENIRSMIKNVASFAANKTKSKRCWRLTKRNYYKAFAAICEKTFRAKYENVINRGEIAKTLATNLLQLGLHATRLAKSTIVGRHDDAKRDQANFDSYFNKIRGEINLVAMNFFMDEAKILSQKPKVVSEKNLVNNTDVDQAMTFGFSMTEGKTHSTSHSIGFSYGIKSSFKAGFSGFAEVNVELSFSFSRSHTFEQSTNTGTSKSVEFPLSVPAHSTYVAKGIVSEAEMEIPYELVFEFGAAHRKVRGDWKGVACSKTTYQVDKKDGPSPPYIM